MNTSRRRNRDYRVKNDPAMLSLRKYYPHHLIHLVLWLPPAAILSIFIIVIAYGLHASPGAQISRKTSFSSATLSDVKGPPTLTELISDIADMLDYHKVTFWLMPGLGLLPATDITGKAAGRLAPWREGIDFGINQSHVMNVIVAQTALQPRGIVAVESYFGLRLFSIHGHSDERYDYNAPFVDLIYFQSHDNHIVSYCCDCEPIVASVCTKKTCGCLVCAAKKAELFPLQNIRIEGIGRNLPTPATTVGLHLSTDFKPIHPALLEPIHHTIT